jgi:hypothetical protein
MLLASLIRSAVQLLLPGAKPWVAEFFSLAVPATIEMVQELQASSLRGSAKFQLAVNEVGELLDAALDEIPEWTDLEEEKRDAIIGGMVELAVFISAVVEDKGKRASRKDMLRAVRAVRSLRKQPGRR